LKMYTYAAPIFRRKGRDNHSTSAWRGSDKVSRSGQLRDPPFSADRSIKKAAGSLRQWRISGRSVNSTKFADSPIICPANWSEALQFSPLDSLALVARTQPPAPTPTPVEATTAP